MSKTILKIFIILVLMVFIINVTNTYASTLGDVISGGKDFLSSGTGQNVKIDENKLKDTSSSVYNILLMISFIIVAVIGIILGIEFMMAGVEEKANIKESLITFLIGCIVVYGAFGIWKVLVSFLNTL